MLTPHQVCNAMSVLTEKIRSGRPAKPILRENLMTYDNYTRLFDRGHVRSVGWDGTNNTSLQPGGGPITLIGTGPKYPGQFTPVKKRHVMALYGTAFAAMNAAMLDDLRQYYAESQEYLKEMKLYDNDPSPQKRLPMRPRVPYKLDMRTTAYESSIPTLDLCLYKELSPRYDDWIEDITKGKNPLNNINAAIRNAEKAFDSAWKAANNKYEYVALEKPFSVSNIPEKQPTLSEEVWAQSSNATSPPLSLEDRVRAMYKDPLTQSLAAFFYNKLVRMEHLKECISHDEKITTGWRILLLNGKRAVKSPASFRSAPYQMAYRKAQRAFEEKRKKEVKQLKREEYVWKREWERYNRAKASQPHLRLNPPPKRNFKKEWQQKNLALTEEMLRTKIQPLTFVEMLQTYNINGEEKREQLYRLWLNGKTHTEIVQLINLGLYAQNILEYTMHQYEYHFSEADMQNFKARETQALQVKNARTNYANVLASLLRKSQIKNGPGSRPRMLIPSSMSPSVVSGIKSKVTDRMSVEEINQIVRALDFKREEMLKRTADEELRIQEAIQFSTPMVKEYLINLSETFENDTNRNTKAELDFALQIAEDNTELEEEIIRLNTLKETSEEDTKKLNSSLSKVLKSNTKQERIKNKASLLTTIRRMEADMMDQFQKMSDDIANGNYLISPKPPSQPNSGEMSPNTKQRRLISPESKDNPVSPLSEGSLDNPMSPPFTPTYGRDFPIETPGTLDRVASVFTDDTKINNNLYSIRKKEKKERILDNSRLFDNIAKFEKFMYSRELLGNKPKTARKLNFSLLSKEKKSGFLTKLKQHYFEVEDFFIQSNNVGGESKVTDDSFKDICNVTKEYFKTNISVEEFTYYRILRAKKIMLMMNETMFNMFPNIQDIKKRTKSNVAKDRNLVKWEIIYNKDKYMSELYKLSNEELQRMLFEISSVLTREEKVLTSKLEYGLSRFADPDLALMQQDQAYASRGV